MLEVTTVVLPVHSRPWLFVYHDEILIGDESNLLLLMDSGYSRWHHFMCHREVGCKCKITPHRGSGAFYHKPATQSGVCITRVLSLRRVILNGHLSSAGNKVWLYEKECVWNRLIQQISFLALKPSWPYRKKILLPHNIVGRRVNEISGKKYL